MAKTTTAPAETSPSSRPPDPPGTILRVRKREQTLTLVARKLTAPQQFSTIDGRVRPGEIGDYVLSYENGVAVDVVGPQELARAYETIVPEAQLTLTPEQITRIAKCVRFGGTATAESLVSAIESLAFVAIGEHRLPFTPGQIAELKLRADKRGMAYDAYVKRIVDLILEQFFQTSF